MRRSIVAICLASLVLPSCSDDPTSPGNATSALERPKLSDRLVRDATPRLSPVAVDGNFYTFDFTGFDLVTSGRFDDFILQLEAPAADERVEVRVLNQRTGTWDAIVPVAAESAGLASRLFSAWGLSADESLGTDLRVVVEVPDVPAPAITMRAVELHPNLQLISLALGPLRNGWGLGVSEAGDFWVSGYGSIARVDETGEILEEIDCDCGVIWGVAVQEGKLWGADEDGNRILVTDLEQEAPTLSIDMGTLIPRSLAMGPAGLWVVAHEFGELSRILLLDAEQSLETSRAVILDEIERVPSQWAVATDGARLFVLGSEGSSDAVYVVDERGDVTGVYRLDVAVPTDIAWGQDHLWIAHRGPGWDEYAGTLLVSSFRVE